MDITGIITKELGIRRQQTEAVIRLIDEGNTIPFIARYRKEAHGNLNDEQLRALDERLTSLRNLEERKNTVLAAIEKQGKLSDALRKEIDEAQTQTAVEDLYRPYRQKRRTRAMIAREAGLEVLAEYILSDDAKTPVLQVAEKYVTKKASAAQVDKDGEDPEAGADSSPAVPDAETAVRMAEDIIAEQVSDQADHRDWIRRAIWKEGLLVSAKTVAKGSSRGAQKSDDAESVRGSAAGKRAVSGTGKRKAAEPVNKKLAAREEVYENYYDFSEPLAKIPGHRVLAINRGEKEKFLTVHIEAPEEKIVEYLYRQLNPRKNPVTSAYIREAVTDAWQRLLRPSLETEIRNGLTDQAEEGAIKVFASNLEQLLMQPPVAGRVVLGWDPAFRTGCKLAVVDETGKVLDTTVIFPTEPQNKVAEAKATLKKLYDQYHYTLISCGNGTASRESEQIIADFIRETKLPIQYVITNEAGASVYSASKLATEEFPNFDVGQRSAASIARRVQDPLAELVKIDPKAIGVGQYQHDMNQTRLDETLTNVVEDCVNRVGVDANTASAALLSYISGINRTTAKNMVAWREQNGRFANRRDFLKVKGLGAKAFEQCAGFLRIRGGTEPLDQTAVHPESYDAARKLLSELGYSKEDVTLGKTADIADRAGRIGAQNTDRVSTSSVRRKEVRKGSPAQTGSKGQKPAAALDRANIPDSALRQLSRDTGLGEFTLRDVISELEKPGRDPRENVPGPVLRSDVLSMDDLKPGMVLRGTVRNIVDFGAFVDIGVHQDGLVHISQLSDSYVKHPLDVVKVGDVVNVRVLSVDAERKRISLSMKDVNA